MIKELKLSGFRLFEKEVTVRFRPITIFIGKNNTGKSSIIQFLRIIQLRSMQVEPWKADNTHPNFSLGIDDGTEADNLKRLAYLSTNSGLMFLNSPKMRGEDKGQGLELRTMYTSWLKEAQKDTHQKKFIVKHLNKILGVDDICLENKDMVGLGSYGSGLHASLPILSQGASMPPKSQFMAEHPDSGLHPDSQIEMGGFFVDLWKTRGVGSIIETHSENLILRIRRCISSNVIPSKDVSIAYFVDGKINNLEIDDRGVIEGLPRIFFDAKLMETLEMSASDGWRY